MRSNPFYFSTLIIFLSLWACKDTSPQPSDMVGHYIVSAQFTDNTIDKEEIKSSISNAMKEVKDEMAKAKDEIKKEFDISTIDTSTVEGKIEYAAKQFGKTMAEIGTNVGELGTNLGTVFSDLTGEGVAFGEGMLKNVKLNVELQADGDIKVEDTFYLLGLNNAKWEVKGDEFLLYKNDNQEPDIFIIKERNKSSGLVLEKDKLEIHLVKK